MDENNINATPDLSQLEWYESTQGPVISRTLIYIATMVVLPVLQQLFGLNLDGHLLGSVIEGAVMVFFGIMAIKAHVATKQAMGRQIGELATELKFVKKGQ